MPTDFLKGKTVTVPTNRVEDRRQSRRTPLMLTAWIWRSEAPDEPLPIRLLDHSESGVGFISPTPMDKGEIISLALEHEGNRRTSLKVTNCEFFSDNAFRVGARSAPAASADNSNAPA